MLPVSSARETTTTRVGLRPTRVLIPSPSDMSQVGRDWPNVALHRKPGHRHGIRQAFVCFIFFFHIKVTRL